MWAERTSRGSYWDLSNLAQVPQCSDWVGQTGSVTNPGITAPTVEFVGGVEQRPIVVVEYDPEWADTFERERERIRVALGSRLVSVQHVGSTAVAGLAAKPIIDVLVTVANVDDEPSYLPALLSAGYLLRVRELGHRMLRTQQLDVHVHVLGSDLRRCR